jgi:NTP pyrophosphatase (non-canonical NTP hydrolase)
LHFRDYQTAAQSTDIHAATDPVAFLLLGIVGEAGVLTSDYKKYLRDRSSLGLFAQRAAEEIGDLLWYTSMLASTLDLSMDDIAARNLVKIADRWGAAAPSERLVLDVGAPDDQRFPRQFKVEFLDNGAAVQILDASGSQIGDIVDNNAHEDDGYRLHDIFHLANAAVLGWSPNLRALMKRKRKYDDRLDRVEDGARAVFTEEGIVAVIFRHAEQQSYYTGVRHVESELLDFVRTAVTGLEVEIRPGSDWESAILQGYEVFRSLRANAGGIVLCDLDAGTITHSPRVPTADGQ